MSPKVLAVVSGIAFGLWPIVMNRSGLPGQTTAFLYAVVGIAVFGVLAFWLPGSFPSGIKGYAIAAAASLVGALGMFFFTRMLSSAPSTEVGRLFILMTIVQIAIPAIAQSVSNGAITTRHLLGAMAAVFAVVLLG